MNRRHACTFLAAVALGLIIGSPAHAGGTSGAVGVKKTATVMVKNKTNTPYYLVVVPPGFNVPATVGQAKRLGAVLVNGNKSMPYPVPAGAGTIFICDPQLVDAKNPNAPLPFPPAADIGYAVARGKVANYRIVAGPVLQPGK